MNEATHLLFFFLLFFWNESFPQSKERMAEGRLPQTCTATSADSLFTCTNTRHHTHNLCRCLITGQLTPEGIPHPGSTPTHRVSHLTLSKKPNCPGHTQSVWQCWQLNAHPGMPWAQGRSQVSGLWHLTQPLANTSPGHAAIHRS